MPSVNGLCLHRLPQLAFLSAFLVSRPAVAVAGDGTVEFGFAFRVFGAQTVGQADETTCPTDPLKKERFFGGAMGGAGEFITGEIGGVFGTCPDVPDGARKNVAYIGAGIYPIRLGRIRNTAASRVALGVVLNLDINPYSDYLALRPEAAFRLFMGSSATIDEEAKEWEGAVFYLDVRAGLREARPYALAGLTLVYARGSTR